MVKPGLRLGQASLVARELAKVAFPHTLESR